MRMFVLVWVFFLAGCSAGVRTPLLEVKAGTGSSLLGINSGVRVVYPHSLFGDMPLAERYGAQWQNILGRYPEYIFN